MQTLLRLIVIVLAICAVTSKADDSKDRTLPTEDPTLPTEDQSPETDGHAPTLTAPDLDFESQNTTGPTDSGTAEPSPVFRPRAGTDLSVTATASPTLPATPVPATPVPATPVPAASTPIPATPTPTADPASLSTAIPTPAASGAANETVFVLVVNNTAVADPLSNLVTGGRAMLVTSGTTKFLSLTPLLQNMRGAARLSLPSVYFPTINFRIFCGGGPGTGGEGIAFSYGANILRNLTALLASGGSPSYGYGDDLVVSFKTSTDARTSRGVNVHFNGASRAPDVAIPVAIRRNAWVDVSLVIAPDDSSLVDPTKPINALLSIALDNSWVLVNQTIENWAPDDTWSYVLSAGTSTSTLVDNQRVSDLKVLLDFSSSVTVTISYTLPSSLLGLDAYSDAALNAAILTARGSPAVIRVVRTVLRTGSSTKGRRMLDFSDSATNSTVEVTIGFEPMGDRSAYQLAWPLVRSIASGVFANTSRDAFLDQDTDWDASGPPDFVGAWYPPTLQDFIVARRAITTSKICSSVAQGNLLSLTCPLGQVVTSLSYALYGTPSGSCLTGFNPSPTCDANTSFANVKAECFGLPACQIWAINSAMGSNPCAGVTKKLAVSAVCNVQCPAKSLISTQKVSVTVINFYGKKIQVKWCDYAFVPSVKCALSTWKSCTFSTYTTHSFIIVETDTQKVLQSIIVPPGWSRLYLLGAQGDLNVYPPVTSN